LAGGEPVRDPGKDLSYILSLNQIRELLWKRIEQFHKRHPVFINVKPVV
jgi:hypothetical protein